MLVAMQQNIPGFSKDAAKSLLDYVLQEYDTEKNSFQWDGPTDTARIGEDYDDFGWWGIASAKAYTSEYLPVFEMTDADGFKKIALSCWNAMLNGEADDPNQVHTFGAPNVWDKCDQKTFSYAAPRFEGGIWQTDINKDNDPHATSLGPFQLSVVNGLYFVLGLRLAAAGQDTGTKINALYEFLMNWCFDSTVTSQDEQLLYIPAHSSPGLGLIRERVSTYKSGEPVKGHCSGVAWSGDQGLMMGGMVDYCNANPEDPQAQSLAITILNGVGQYMQMTLNNSTFITPWYPASYGSDPNDYGSGPGVFMRYLLYGYKHNPQIKAQLIDENSQIRGLLFSSADACFNGTFPDFVGGQASDPLFNLFNQLSILTTAIYVLADQGKTEP
jgi:hypothetical protein